MFFLAGGALSNTCYVYNEKCWFMVVSVFIYLAGGALSNTCYVYNEKCWFMVVSVFISV